MNSHHFKNDHLDSDDPLVCSLFLLQLPTIVFIFPFISFWISYKRPPRRSIKILHKIKSKVSADADNSSHGILLLPSLKTKLASSSGTSKSTSDKRNHNLDSVENHPQWEKQASVQIKNTRETIAAIRENLKLQEAALKSLEEEFAERKERYHAYLNGNMVTRGAGSSRKARVDAIDYEKNRFQWDASMEDKMKSVFGIQSFRLCQRGVCNANMDGRDIVVVMPTGGGKSLTYQLPAILNTGVTLVLSPLISLITDQVMHLRSAGVEAVKITGSTPKSDQDVINAKLGRMIAGRDGGADEIKLLYCTPEKIAKSKRFLTLLQRLADASKLVRIVIDEAHCVSQLGHDFRPDYQKLHILRQLFPHVPIMALSATCPPLVLADLLKVLRLGPTVSPDAAPTSKDPPRTLYFTSPLYRPNLHYQVLPKATDSSKVFEEMTMWILANHRDDSGIVYCLSKRDAEKVAEELHSRGNIRTGVYHSERSESEKEKLHMNWQEGIVKVVCATIAFGLGIDKGDVRFVIHHSLSKSLDGYYQESGRAGRDGKDSDCILYYRAQDALTLSSMAMADKDGSTKLYAMLSFAQNLTECRKIQFANYFSHSANISLTSWSTSAHDVCTHCDNCTRSKESFDTKDVTVEAWQLLRIVDEVMRTGGSATLAKVVELARSSGKAAYSGANSDGKKGRKRFGERKEAVIMDLDAVCGGKVDMRKEDVETLVVDLLLQGYFKEHYHSTPYSTVVYLQLGKRAPRLLRVTSKEALAAETPRLSCSFRNVKRLPRGRPSLTSNRKGKNKAIDTSMSSDIAKEQGHSGTQQFLSKNAKNFDENRHTVRSTTISSTSRTSSTSLQNGARHRAATNLVIISDEDEDECGSGAIDNESDGGSEEEEDVDDWVDVATRHPPRKRRKTSHWEEGQLDEDVIELSSD